jgi:hypothetical protein
MRRGHWILDENRIPRQVDLYTWAKWFGEGDRIVRQEWIGNIWISTVFLGLDHNFSNTGPPILWETMMFSNRKNVDQNYMTRCAGSWEQAEAMHEAAVREACKVEQINYQPLEQRQ